MEINKIKKSHQGKHLFGARKNLYKMSVESLIRLRYIDENGKEHDSDEVHVYPEGGPCPYDIINGVSFHQEDVLPELDLIRGEAKSPFTISNRLAKTIGSLKMGFLEYGGLAFVGIILAYAFITGGI